MKYQFVTSTILIASLAACGGSLSSGDSDYDDNQNYGDSPYDFPKYQDALDSADLLINDAIIKKAGEFSDFSNDYFSIDSNSYWMTLTAEGEGSHTLLRFSEGFATDDQNFHRLKAEILPRALGGAEQEATLLQINNDQGYAPLLRITWDTVGNNHYVAMVNTGDCSEADAESINCYSEYSLANYNASSATKFVILVEDNQLTVSVDNQKMVDLDISSWPTIDNYFSAGIDNLGENSSSIAQFKTLTYNSNLPIADLDASGAPSDNFDLLDWYLSVPTDEDGNGKSDSINETDLANGHEDEFFYTGSDGGMVFVCPIDGYKTSENTSYTRTELREMLRRGDTNISTQGVNENNWVFSSTSDSSQSKAGGVDGILEATLSVNAVTSTGDSDQVGRVIVGQIHANDDEPIRLYYRLLKGHSKGSLYFAHEPRTGSEQWITLIGSRGDGASQPSDGIALDEKFYYKIKVQGNLLIVTIKRDYKDDITRTWDMSASGYDDSGQYMYFKAGVYNQNKSGNGDDFVQATFYYLDNQHQGYED